MTSLPKTNVLEMHERGNRIWGNARPLAPHNKGLQRILKTSRLKKKIYFSDNWNCKDGHDTFYSPDKFAKFWSILKFIGLNLCSGYRIILYFISPNKPKMMAMSMNALKPPSFAEVDINIPTRHDSETQFGFFFVKLLKTKISGNNQIYHLIISHVFLYSLNE